MKDEIFRAPLESDNGYYVYTWNEPSLYQMEWSYTVEWPASGKPTIWIHSYRSWQRQKVDEPWEEAENLPFDIPMSDLILRRLTEHAAQQLYRRSVVVGSMKSVPDTFLAQAEEAAGKRYHIRLLREMLTDLKRAEHFCSALFARPRAAATSSQPSSSRALRSAV